MEKKEPQPEPQTPLHIKKQFILNKK